MRLDTGGRSDRTCFQTGACFLTTAAVDVVGLPDDCWELRQLRAFRDRYAARGPAQAKTMANYYRIAPVVVHRVDARRERARTWLSVYFGSIVPAAIAAQLGWDRLALVIYSRMTQRLIATFVQEQGLARADAVSPHSSGHQGSLAGAGGRQIFSFSINRLRAKPLP